MCAGWGHSGNRPAREMKRKCVSRCVCVCLCLFVFTCKSVRGAHIVLQCSVCYNLLCFTVCGPSSSAHVVISEDADISWQSHYTNNNSNTVISLQ